MAAGSSFSIHFIKVKLFYQSAPFFIHHMETSMISSAQYHCVHEHCLKHHTPEFGSCPCLIFVSKFVPLTSSPAVHSHDWEGLLVQLCGYLVTGYSEMQGEVSLLCFSLQNIWILHGEVLCSSCAAQGWACNARELLFPAFPEEASRFKYSVDFIQAPEMLSSLWHPACFFSAVPPDGASSGEGLSWKDVKELQLNCATKEYVHWAETKTEISK